MKTIIQEANAELSKICKDPAKFLMSSPANPSDSDMKIQAALTCLEQLHDLAVRLRRTQRELSIAHLQSVGQEGHIREVEPIQRKLDAIETQIDVLLEIETPYL